MPYFMEYAIAKVSTKGQIVIPSTMRKNIHTGDEFLILKDEKRIILKNLNHISAELKDDLKFAEEVEKAWQKHDRGEFITETKEEFLRKLRACKVRPRIS